MIARKPMIIMFVIWLLASGFGLWMFPSLPNPAPTHWNIRGEADGWGSPWVSVALMPLISLAVLGLLIVLPRMGPLRENFERFRDAYATICVVTTLALAALHVIIVVKTAGSTIPIGASIATVLGLLFMVMGNLLGKIRRNFYVGIRTPWTLANETVWEKTHRLGGRLFMLAGLLTVITAWITSEMVGFIVMMSGLVLTALWTVVYSYLCYRKLGCVDDLVVKS